MTTAGYEPPSPTDPPERRLDAPAVDRYRTQIETGPLIDALDAAIEKVRALRKGAIAP